jgi:transposase
MHDCITVAHKLPHFDVTTDPEFLPCADGSIMVRTAGTVTLPVPSACPRCSSMMRLHAYETVHIRDIPIFNAQHLLEVRYQRHRCSCCGAEVSQDIPFKTDGHFITDRYARLVSRYLGYGMTNKTVHRLLGLNVHLVKALDKGRLEGLYGKAPKTPSRYIAIDEISIHSHHRYATVVIDLETGHVLFCEAGKRKQQVQHFIQYVGKQWLSKVVAVSMDMNAQYDSAFKEAAPHIQIVYDPFHLIKLYGDSVITKLRRRLQQEALEREDRATYEELKGGRFILLSNRRTLEAQDSMARENNRDLSENYERKGLQIPAGRRRQRTGKLSHLDRLMGVNKGLNVAYVLLEQFKLAYAVRDPLVLESGMHQWCHIARQSKIPELLSFAATVENHLQGIVNHAYHPISSGKLEGTNNLAKVIKRNAYGFVDDEYFFLKLMAASRRPYYKPRSPRFLH